MAKVVIVRCGPYRRDLAGDKKLEAVVIEVGRHLFVLGWAPTAKEFRERAAAWPGNRQIGMLLHSATSQGVHRLSGLRGVDEVTIAKLMVRHFVEFSAANPQLHRIIMQESKRAGGRLDWMVETHVRPLYEYAVAMFERLAARGELAPVAPAHLYYLLTGAGATVFVMAPECQRLTGVDPFAPEFVAAHADLVVDLLIRATTKESV